MDTVTSVLNHGDTAWMLMAAALVLLMTPGLSLFYSGLVPSRNAINTINMSFICLAVVPIIWVVLGYTLAFAPGNGVIGDTRYVLLHHITSEVQSRGTTPELSFMIFQLMFAIVTPALISGAMVGRIKFKAYILFVAMWSILVYSPIAHWVWSPSGWLNQMGAIDFAGGTVVHINAGFSALAAILVFKSKDGASNRSNHLMEDVHVPHNVPLVILGSSLLWFGWFGFNAGSAGAANGLAALACATTMLAASAAVFTWMVLSWIRNKPITATGSAVAVVVGLVAITPAAGFVSPLSSIVIGVCASALCYGLILYKEKLMPSIEDPLDVFVCHGVSGIVGSLLTGVFADAALNSAGKNGLLYGNPMLLVNQAIAVLATLFTCMAGTILILFVLKLFIKVNADEGAQQSGVDVKEHGEFAYELNSVVKELFESKKNLEKANVQLNEEMSERKKMEQKASVLNNQLVVAARRAGMTDIATSVLHNIGNVLNSVNISSYEIGRRIKEAEISNLPRVVELLEENKHHLSDFFTKDQRGVTLVDYLKALCTTWKNEEEHILNEVKSLEKNIQHIKEIITMQQAMSMTISITEEVNISELIEDALTLNKTAYERVHVKIIRDFSPLRKVMIDKVKLLQIMVNLIKNSIDSLFESQQEEKILRLVLKEKNDQYFTIDVEDNGLGIAPLHLTKIFSYGFTTKKNGHGFGLHTSVLAAQELMGNLNVSSKGLNLGATFTLTLPYDGVKKKGGSDVVNEIETENTAD